MSRRDGGISARFSKPPASCGARVSHEARGRPWGKLAFSNISTSSKWSQFHQVERSRILEILIGGDTVRTLCETVQILR